LIWVLSLPEVYRMDVLICRMAVSACIPHFLFHGRMLAKRTAF
jgi:hypothetical protein